MTKLLILLLLIPSFVGCSSLPKVKNDIVTQQKSSSQTSPKELGEESPIQEIVEEEIPTGIVFGKTDFKGVLKANFVKLTIENVLDSENQYLLYIGLEEGETNLPWNSKSVEPGYFFVELPHGEYRITTVSIPVGSTMAEEVMSITFFVEEDVYTYIGTLDMTGTKEKIKFGGMPVIKPGFEYQAKVIDERQEAYVEFKGSFPDEIDPLKNDIMVMHPLEKEEPVKDTVE